MKLYREESGVISYNKIWIFIDKCWIYTDESLFKLIYIVITQWRSDKHLVG